ncbi:hypothetical protein BT93_B2472 [Corymbia citriodora subsp. variegata]|nr:hypothetical protein BT93_B2472 [Corymbia citriodora subsp. variegata]
MSAGFELGFTGAVLQHSLSSSAPSCSAYDLFITVACCALCCFWQRLNLVSSSVSMRLRPKRSCSGEECFGGFHIKPFSNPFLFLMVVLT